MYQVNSSLKTSAFAKRMYKEANRFQWQEINDTDARRQFQKITSIGTSALDDEQQLKQVQRLKCCLYFECRQLYLPV